MGLSCRARRISRSLIPVLVTGIQPPRVGAVKDSCNGKEPPASKDLDALDSCDIPRVKPEDRNEGALAGPLRAGRRHP
ncbi:hypothetical protein GFL39_25010 [Rhizobium leguminosarum bv. viciae]|nr:hypothetical protein [Rhizobium leguminosarum bv. viciae]NKL08138.1 hypothetical protein [Rhizobium leguminosarum bv. viciae]NKL82874.1 hypothetical protein [Rhizobium leguminosarum bv. viciae]NKL93792.1 hypothetical protein [Rhizobium leguminosarum bv. viciae]NKM93981.1 hypothetical protein [Rhizobium leguminosarum bv. viciae]